MRRSEFPVLLLVEAEDDLRPLDHDRPPDQVGVLHHQRDGLLLRRRQRPLLEHRAARADEVEEPFGVDVRLQELPRRRLPVDVDLVDVNAGRVQKTSGILAGRSRRFRVERRSDHGRSIIDIADFRRQISDWPGCHSANNLTSEI